VAFEAVVLLNDGACLSLARIGAGGRLELASLPYDLPVDDPVQGRFFDTDGLVVDRHPCGLRLTPTSADPALPRPPGTARWVEVLDGGRAAVVSDTDLLLYDGTAWTRFSPPTGVQPQSATYLDRWWIGGSRGGRPVLFDPVTGAEDDVPWQRRRWAPHRSDGTSVRVRRTRTGLLVDHDDGLLERSVTHVYLRVGGHWCGAYVGDDLTSRLGAAADELPPVLLNSGRWLVPTATATARILAAPAVGEQLRKEARQRNVVWSWVGAADGEVTALTSLWPAGEHVLLRGRVGGDLAPVMRWPRGGVRPVSATLAETSGFDWASP
jgi:hypothetical protein